MTEPLRKHSTEPVAYWVLQARPTGEIIPRHYRSRDEAVRVRSVSGVDDRVLGMSRYGEIVVDHDAAGPFDEEPLAHDRCAIARAGRRGAGPCREQCTSCRRWWPEGGEGA